MAIKVEHLTKEYGTQKAIDDIGFEIQQGEIVGFLGPNGAGKTTTMKIITCYIQPEAGNVHLNEFNIFDHPLEIRRRTGYLPEHNPLYLDMYVHEYLRFTGSLHALAGKALSNRVKEIVDQTGLGPEQHKKIGMLSKGYRQRVGLAQALLHNPDFLILDEPTTGLDPNQIVEIRKLIQEIGKEKTILFSTHILPEVEAIADRVIIINRGKIMIDESMENLAAEGADEKMFKVEFEQPGFNVDELNKVNVVSETTDPSGKSFVFRANEEVDVRRILFEQSIQQNNSIDRLNKVEQSLEELFREVTKSTTEVDE